MNEPGNPGNGEPIAIVRDESTSLTTREVTHAVRGEPRRVRTEWVREREERALAVQLAHLDPRVALSSTR